MKKSILLILLTVVIVSCQPNNPTPTTPTTTPSAGIYGDWYWYKMDAVNYDSNGDETYRNSSNYPTQNVHTYKSDGIIYIQNSTSSVGEHSNSNLVKYYNQNGMEFHVTELTATTMVMKQNPNGCNNCSSLEYFFKRP